MFQNFIPKSFESLSMDKTSEMKNEKDLNFPSFFHSDWWLVKRRGGGGTANYCIAGWRQLTKREIHG